jgi:hypothetical protein
MVVKIVTIYSARDKSVLISKEDIGHYELFHSGR